MTYAMNKHYQTISKNALPELVINWHMTEACNFKCVYCFAKWEKDERELLHSNDNINLLLDEIGKLPKIIATHKGVQFGNIRLNLVGGETFLYQEKALYIIKEAKKRGFSLSAITNGSKLNNELIHAIANHLDSIGFSVDADDVATNFTIGRRAKDVMNLNQLQQDIMQLRQINPNIDIKINTVVSQFNHKSYLGDFISQVRPNKWKIFKVLPSITDKYSITDEDFENYVARHQHFSHLIFSENNEEMTESYLMIDPLGRFFQNSNRGQGSYIYSKPIIKQGIQKAFDDIVFDVDKFFGRYQSKKILVKNI